MHGERKRKRTRALECTYYIPRNTLPRDKVTKEIARKYKNAIQKDND